MLTCYLVLPLYIYGATELDIMASAVIKPKCLEHQLQKLEDVATPSFKLEQYKIPPEIAAHLLWQVQEFYNDIEDKDILDLGCGCGILGIGCLLLGAKSVVAVDIDEYSLEVAKKNAASFVFSERITFLHQDVSSLDTQGIKCDTTIMNPPFGTRDQVGIDAVFVKKALEMSNVVYSIHKKERTFWKKKGKEWKIDVTPLIEVKFNLDQRFKFHKSSTRDIEVDFIRFLPI